MECGYLLAHVLEAVVPGHDLGEGSSCEVVLGASMVHCPIPSTLRSENVALPFLADQLSDVSELVVHIRAFDSSQRAVGIVVVPVTSLVPMEVWNVWYAMDEGEEEPEEVPPDEPPKMHLLLQHVPADAAALETLQQREMRSQDFLLRALQQLNASLEAKVSAHQDRSPPPARPAMPAMLHLPAGSQSFGTDDAGQPVPLLAAGGPLGPAVAPLRHVAPHSPTDGQPPQHSGHTQLCGQGAHQGGRVVTSSGAPAGKSDDFGNNRMHSYERVVATLEEKQRFYDDQEDRLASLTRSLDEQHVSNRALNTKLQEAASKHQSALELEVESTRRTHASMAALEEQLVELQEEVALRKAHEDSLQRRATLMESELSVVHHKCVTVDSAEEEAQNLRREADQHKEAKTQMHRQFEDSDRQLATLREELANVRESHQRELEQAGTRLSDARREQEVVRQTLHISQDVVRDADVKKRLLNERIEGLLRQVTTLQGEVSNYEAMLGRERKHRDELERKLEEQALCQFDVVLDEHRQAIESLREQLADTRCDAQNEQSKSASLATELAALRRELAQAHRQQAENRSLLAQADEVRLELHKSRERCNELRAQLKAMQKDTQKVAETHQDAIAEHSNAQQVLCKERNGKQQEIGALRLDLSRAQRQVEELVAAKDQMSTSLRIAQETGSRIDELERHGQQGTEEIREYHGRRDEVHNELKRFTSKFRNDATTQDQRVVELEGALEDRNNEIKLLMYRVQELSSKYTSCKGDPIDMVLAKWVNGYRPAVPFFRLAQGLYLFGRRQVMCKISNDKPVFRVGGGFIGFDKFLELYASEELERLLNYEIDERTGDPKFMEAQRVQASMADSGCPAESRGRAEVTLQGQSRSILRK